MRSAIGFDQRRGDQVEVVNLRFAELPQNLISEPKGLLEMPQFTRDDIMRGIELLVMGLLGLIVLFFVVRPLVRRIVTPERPMLSAGAAAGALAAPDAETAADASAAITNHTSTMIDIAQVQGQVHAQSVQKVGELADRNPHETAAIIRQWLSEAA